MKKNILTLIIFYSGILYPMIEKEEMTGTSKEAQYEYTKDVHNIATSILQEAEELISKGHLQKDAALDMIAELKALINESSFSSTEDYIRKIIKEIEPFAQ